MDIKKKIEEIVNKLQNDKDLMKKFETNPAGLVNEYLGVSIPEDQVNQIVDGIKAKMTADKVGDAISGIKDLFGGKK